MESPEFRAAYFKEGPKKADSATRQRHVAEVDEWALLPPPQIKMWCAANDVAEIPVGEADRNGICKRLKRQGYDDYRKQWMRQSRRQLTRVFDKRKQGSFTELLWRIVEKRFSSSADTLRRLTMNEDEDNAKYLGRDEAYVYSHPGLCLSEADLSDPVVKMLIGEYEEATKPTRGAVNLFHNCRSDDKYRNDFLKQCQVKAAAGKAKAQSSTKSKINPADAKNIEDVRAAIQRIRDGPQDPDAVPAG